MEEKYVVRLYKNVSINCLGSNAENEEMINERLEKAAEEVSGLIARDRVEALADLYGINPYRCEELYEGYEYFDAVQALRGAKLTTLDEHFLKQGNGYYTENADIAVLFKVDVLVTYYPKTHDEPEEYDEEELKWHAEEWEVSEYFYKRRAKWNETKAKNGGKMLLFKLGDFYMVWFEDAEKVSDALGINCFHLGETVPRAQILNSRLDEVMGKFDCAIIEG